MIHFSDFLKRAFKKHGNKFSYDENTYKNYETPFDIRCPIHGISKQIPKFHITGHGCAQCGNMSTSKKLSSNSLDFINKAKIIHGNKYDYSKVDYSLNRIPVIIICKIHGEFMQKPNYHLLGNGCPNCGGTKRLSKENFIERGNFAHNNKYDYSNIIYSSNKQKVQIVCRKHGKFLQSPSHHLMGSGCPQCNESKGEKLICFILKKNNISFVREKKFDDCRYKKKLPFDFYLPDLNICIEYDGEQHFEAWRMQNKKKAEEKLKLINLRDSIKTQYCLDNNIRLVRIKYTDNIEDKVKVILYDKKN